MSELLSQVSLLELAAVVFAVAYLLLAIRQNPWCWLAAFVSSILSMALFYGAQIYMQTALQVFYAGMAVYGWQQWVRGDSGRGVRIKTWRPRTHVVAIASIFAVSGVFAWLLTFTDQAMPFVDSFTAVAAIVTTYMVAHKILENWAYWFVIDSVSVYLYLSRGLPLYALLFLGYLVLIVIGYRRWLSEWRAIAGRSNE